MLTLTLEELFRPPLCPIGQVGDFHCPYRTCEDAGLCSTADADDSDDPSPQAEVVKEFSVKVGESFVSGVEGYWQSAHGGADAGGGGNPYAAAVLVMADLGSKSLKRKVHPRYVVWTWWCYYLIVIL